MVAVIIPAYNPGPYLRIAVQSVLDQTYQNWELVVVDDGSSEDISAAIPARSANVRLIRQENRGLSIARNVGLLATESKYVAFLDADDVWAPTKLERQVALMESDESLGFCHTQFDIVDQDARPVGPGYAENVQGYHELLEGCTVCISTAMARRSALAFSGLFDTMLKTAQDYDMWLKISRKAGIGFVESHEVLYRWHSQNLSHQYMLTHDEVARILREHIAMARLSGDDAAIAAAKRGMRHNDSVCGRQAYKQFASHARGRRLAQSVKHLANAARLAPRHTVRTLLTRPAPAAASESGRNS